MDWADQRLRKAEMERKYGHSQVLYKASAPRWIRATAGKPFASISNYKLPYVSRISATKTYDCQKNPLKEWQVRYWLSTSPLQFSHCLSPSLSSLMLPSGKLLLVCTHPRSDSAASNSPLGDRFRGASSWHLDIRASSIMKTMMIFGQEIGYLTIVIDGREHICSRPWRQNIMRQ